MTVAERLWAKVDRSAGLLDCWTWTASTTGIRKPYGQLWVDGRLQLAHRLVYEMLVGPIPEGLELDHLCRNQRCVNPAHLEAVTRSENIRRSPLLGLAAKRRAHCPTGHAYDARNTYVDKLGKRYCRTCSNARRNLYRHPRVEAL